MMPGHPDLQIRRERPDAEDARTLIEELDTDLLLRYPKQFVHGLHPEDAGDEKVIFLVVRQDEDLIGCGALRPLGDGAAEIKRMFVRTGFRRRGISRRILAALEDIAREKGYTTVRLETGREQPEALALYQSAGYEQIPRYGEYVDDPFSVCFEKRLNLS